MQDRSLLLRRQALALQTVRAQPEVDADRIAAIGFCFGGLCVLDLARSGADVRGVVSFHGLLKPSGLPAQPIVAKALVLHGDADPMAPIADVLAFREEFARGGCDWQLHMYGHTLHAFAVLGVDLPDIGARHDAAAERRSMQAMRNFLEEVLA
jgi:dienelactone hydrolase